MRESRRADWGRLTERPNLPKVGFMKRAFLSLAIIVALAVARPCMAQYDDESRNGAYNDVQNGQPLQIVGYALTPLGMALEWGVTRPLHHLATKSAIAPILSGDTETVYFGQNNNASRLPPGTFAPFQMPENPNEIVPDKVASEPGATGSAAPSSGSQRYLPGGQRVLPPVGSASPPPGQAVMH
jgi:hypothetical protein